MVAILGLLILGDGLSGMATVAIAVSAAGVFALSLGQNQLSVAAIVGGMASKATFIGLLCAAWLGGSVVFFRGASLALEHDQFVAAAGYTLFVSLVIQTVLMGGYLLIREPGEFSRVLKNWRWGGAAGVAGALGSIGWFTAFTIQNASYVRALGQIELVFTFIATTLFFREKVGGADLLGIVLVSSGIVILLLLG